MPYKNKDDLYEAQRLHRLKNKVRILEFLRAKECVDCGEKDPIVLEFDHVEPHKKAKPVSRMLSGHYSWKSIQYEIEKCEIRCANCHRRKSYVQLKHFGKTLP